MVGFAYQRPTQLLHCIREEASSLDLKDGLPAKDPGASHLHQLMLQFSLGLEKLAYLAQALSRQLKAQEGDVNHLAVVVGLEEVRFCVESLRNTETQVLPSELVFVVQHVRTLQQV